MTSNRALDELSAAGERTIRTGKPVGTAIPLAQCGVVFRQMFEYAVADYVLEVGFFSHLFGFETVAMTSDYALFRPADGSFHLSFRAADDVTPATSTHGLKLLFMTSDLDASIAHVAGTRLTHMEVHMGSAVQRVLHLRTPAGLAIEIWEDPEPGTE